MGSAGKTLQSPGGPVCWGWAGLSLPYCAAAVVSSLPGLRHAGPTIDTNSSAHMVKAKPDLSPTSCPVTQGKIPAAAAVELEWLKLFTLKNLLCKIYSMTGILVSGGGCSA